MHKLIFRLPKFFLYVCKTFCLRCQGNGFLKAELTYLFKGNTVIQILQRVNILICEISGKNGQVVHSLTVFLAVNFKQRAITFCLDRN